MKKYIQIITVTILLGSLLIPGITNATPPAPAASPSKEAEKELFGDNADAAMKKKDEEITGKIKGMVTKQCEDDPTDTASCKEKQDLECKAYSKDSEEYGKKELTCEEMEKVDIVNKKTKEEKAAADAKAEADMKAECMKQGFKSCAEKYEAEKTRQSAGFKFNLNALALTSGGEKQGKAIFANKDYAKYGVVVGTLLRVTDILIMLIGSLAMITLIIAGIFMITNHGDEAWVTKGKTMMLYSILGILFALLSFAFVNIIQSALA